MPPIQGAWLNPQTQELIIEEPVVIYSYIEPEIFALRLGELRDFIHRLGAERLTRARWLLSSMANFI